MHEISISKKAIKALEKLDKPDKRRVMAGIDALATNPRPQQATPLVNRGAQWRLRIGNYRVIYEIKDNDLLILVIDLGHRSQIYKH